jgi:hypothetical protein
MRGKCQQLDKTNKSRLRFQTLHCDAPLTFDKASALYRKCLAIISLRSNLAGLTLRKIVWVNGITAT